MRSAATTYDASRESPLRRLQSCHTRFQPSVVSRRHRVCSQQQHRCTVPVCSVPKAVVFDLGKVLLDFDYQQSARRLAAACGAPKRTKEEVLLELFGHAPQPTGLLDEWGGRSLVEQLERGQLSNEEFYTALVRCSGLEVEFCRFAELYADIFTPVSTMIQQQQLLCSHGVPTYLLSNCSGLHIDHVRRRHSFLDSFTGLCLSYEVCSFKPEPEIYIALEQMTGMQGPDLVFIDDRSENAAAAAARGWHAIHHTEPDSTMQRLQQLGLPVVGKM